MNYRPRKTDGFDIFKKTRLHFALNFSLLGILFVVIIFGLVLGIVVGNNQRHIESIMDYTVNLMNVETFQFPPMNERKCGVVAYYPDGTLRVELEDYDDEMTEKILASVLSNKQNFKIKSHNFQSKGFVKYLPDGRCLIYAVYDCTTEYSSLRYLFFLSLFLLGGASLIIVGAGWLLSGYNIKPLREAFFKQKELVANASHELKTPLAIISANLGALSSSPEARIIP